MRMETFKNALVLETQEEKKKEKEEEEERERSRRAHRGKRGRRKESEIRSGERRGPLQPL